MSTDAPLWAGDGPGRPVADDARTDAQARDSEASAGVLWEGHLPSQLFPGMSSIERYRVRADGVNVFACVVGKEHKGRREYPADYKATARVTAHLAERLAAVERERMAQVERVTRQAEVDAAAMSQDDLIVLMFRCFDALRARGWQDAMHAPKGTRLEVIEAGSTGIHKATRDDTGFWTADEHDTYPSDPILYRLASRARAELERAK